MHRFSSSFLLHTAHFLLFNCPLTLPSLNGYMCTEFNTPFMLEGVFVAKSWFMRMRNGRRKRGCGDENCDATENQRKG